MNEVTSIFIFLIILVWAVVIFDLFKKPAQSYYSFYKPNTTSNFLQQQTINNDFTQFTNEWHVTLLKYVPFYLNLSVEKQQQFQEKIIQFLQQVYVVAIDFQLTSNDYLFIATSAILPIFQLQNWMYPQLRKIVLHLNTLGTFEDSDGEQLYTAGFVDFSETPDTIHIARNVLWHDFVYDTPSQVAIHEFLHMIDYSDNNIDGVPLLLIERKYIEPWIELMAKEMKNILTEKSNINSYAGEGNAEFLATVSEYYFKQPTQLYQQHPELYLFLNSIFNKQNAPL